MALPDVYPAQVGSPYTTLSAAYTTGGTTMSVVDATKLPDAPNIVCLSGSVSGEFRYTGKDGNNLTGVSALTGTPTTTWAIGTYAFRGIAAYDVTSLQQRSSAVQSQVDFLAQLNSPIIGIEWDTASSSPTLTRIDAAGTELEGTDTTFFDKHAVFGTRWRCVRDRATGQISFGANARGDGLTLTGVLGDVLVRKQAYYAKTEFDDGTDLARFWVSPRPAKGFSLHPYWYMRNGGAASPVMYSGAYEAYGYLDGSTFKLGSASGKTPITGEVSYPDLPNSGRFHIDDAETYAGNIAPGFGCESFWGYCADQLLMYIEYGTIDIQTALGKGVVDLASGEGFAGKQTGADGIDALLAENGTGVGSGTDGQTPICYRGEENKYGNMWKFVIGANFDADGEVRVIRRDGLGTLAGTLAAGSYETVTGAVPLSNGYISGLQHGDLEGLAFLPSAAAGSSSTGLCDYWYAPTGDGRILLAGGYWNSGTYAGPGCRHANCAPSSSGRDISARLEFCPQGGVA